jgi:serine/threonine protein kinase
MMTKTGTPIYTAPEVHKFAFRYSEAVDMWGAGIILFVILSGERPFNDSE